VLEEDSGGSRSDILIFLDSEHVQDVSILSHNLMGFEEEPVLLDNLLESLAEIGVFLSEMELSKGLYGNDEAVLNLPLTGDSEKTRFPL